MDASLNIPLGAFDDCPIDRASIHAMDVSQLTRGMKSMSDAAYREFFRRYYQRLWAYLYAVSGGNESMVEDALQATFTRVIKHIRVFDTESIFWGWLTRLAKSAYIDCYRKESVFRRLIRRFRDDACSDPVESVGVPAEASWARLESGLNRLNQDEQALVRSKYFDGRSYESIAKELGLTAKAVESRLVRVRRKLRRLMTEGPNCE